LPTKTPVNDFSGILAPRLIRKVASENDMIEVL
jgi:hypothetical protein